VLQAERVATAAPSGVTGAWIGRDEFIAETAVQLDRMTKIVARLQHDMDRSNRTVAAMADEATRTQRLQSFEDTLKNSRDYKIGDLQRACRELKSRVDVMEGDKGTFSKLTYRSFAAVDRRFAELGTLECRLAELEASTRHNRSLFYATLVLAAAALASHLIF